MNSKKYRVSDTCGVKPDNSIARELSAAAFKKIQRSAKFRKKIDELRRKYEKSREQNWMSFEKYRKKMLAKERRSKQVKPVSRL